MTVAADPEIVSKSEFGRRIGVSHNAVANYLKRGKIGGAALTADGRIIVSEALRQLDGRLDRPMSAPVRADDDGDEAASIWQVRLAKEKLVVERLEDEAAVRRGELVSAAMVEKRYSEELADLMLAVEQFIVDLPAKLGLGREAEDIARREFRTFRQRRAEQASAHAA